MSNTVNISSNPGRDSDTFAISDSASLTVPSKDAFAISELEKQTKEEALESHEVIDLQAFSEKKPWIEERIKFLEEMPAIEVFIGLEAVRASAEVVPGLPSRATIEEWLAKHDRVDKETEIFDTAELEKLRQLTKAATHRNLSPADTDVIESTLMTIFSLDKLLQLLRERSASLELIATRLTWEEHRSAAWVERRMIIADLTHFITSRARWSTSIYDNPVKDDLSLARRGSVNSFASAGSDSSVNLNSTTFSRSVRFKLAEMLSRDAAYFGSRVTTLRHGRIASAGKALDKLIDLSRVPVPEELLDEQDRLEEKGITELEQIGKFAMNLVMQWRKADEIHIETIKDQTTAQNLLEEIETAKLHHPLQRQCNSFMSRADVLLKRLSVRVNPVTTPHFFPRPTHPLFESQQEFNLHLAQILAAEIHTAIDLVNKASISAKQYQKMFEVVKKLGTVLEDAIEIFQSLKAFQEQMEIGVSNINGDGSVPSLSTERCLETGRHSVFLALWPSLSAEVAAALKRTDAIVPELQASLALFDASDVRDPEYRRQAMAEAQQLWAMRELVEVAFRKMLDKLDHLREARRIASNVEMIRERFYDFSLQVKEVMEQTRWRQDTLHNNMPLTPESPTLIVEDDSTLPPLDFAKQLTMTREAIINEAESPYVLLSQHLGTPLREHFTRKFALLKGLAVACEDMLDMLVALQQQASAMISAREECHALQLRIENMKIRSSSMLESILANTDRELTTDGVAVFNREVDCLQTNVKAFTEGLVFRVPFVARQSPSITMGTVRQRSLSLEPSDMLIRGHEFHFDLLSVDGAVRADCNSFSMRLGGEIDGLLKCNHHLALARLSKDLDVDITETIAQIYDVTQELSKWKIQMEQLTKDGSNLDSLNRLLEEVEEYSLIHRKSITQRFPSHQEQLRRMEILSTTLDQPIREMLYMTRVRTVGDLELRFTTCSENIASFKKELDQVIRIGLFRLEEAKRDKERKQREAAEQKQAEEEQQGHEEEGKRLREEEKRQTTMRLAEEACIQHEKSLLAEVKAERQRLEQERVEAEKKAFTERQEAEGERLRLEQQHSATMETRWLQVRKERDELALRLQQLQEELSSTKRLQLDQQKTSAEQTAKTVSDLEKQRRDLEDLLRKYRDELDALKTLESQAQRTQEAHNRSSKAQNMPISIDTQDIFTLEVLPTTPNLRSREMMGLETRISTLRRRLSALALKDVSSSHTLPTSDQTKRFKSELMDIVNEVDFLPQGVNDKMANGVLRSFQVELEVALEQTQHLERLSTLNSRFQNCDAALNDLLEHINNYPAPPAVIRSSFSATKLSSPEKQLFACIKFTKDVIDSIDELAQPLLSDSRVATEHSRTLQTWNDLVDMANDRIGRKSRPGSTIDCYDSSGWQSATSVRTSESGTSRSSHSKKESYSGLSLGPKPSRPTRGGLLAPPHPVSTQRRVKSGISEATPRASSKPSMTSRSVSNPFSASLYQPTFSSRQRATSLSSSSNAPLPPLVKRSSHNPLRTKTPTGSLGRRVTRPTSPAMSESSSSRSILRTSRHSRASLGGASLSANSGSTWSRAPRNSLSSILPSRAATPQKKERSFSRKKYVPDPKSKLDVAVGDVVNNLPVGINIEGLTETWQDKSGKYWIGNQDPKLCFCRILRSQTVMVRVGGGWQELSKFIKDHFADSFESLPESPPHANDQQENWISSATLLEAAEVFSSDTGTKSPSLASPRTPEPRFPFVPSFSLLTPGGQSPRSIGSSPSTKGSPLTPMQFIRRAEPDSALLRPATPTKQPRGNNSYTPPLRLWRP